MKAFMLRSYGGAEALKCEEGPEPTIGARDLLIEVHAAGVNPLDFKIHAGAGGVGTFAIQWAKILGAHVATTASASSFDLCRKLGADEVIDYHAQRFEEMLSDYDVVFDTLGGDVQKRSFSVLKRGGTLV